MWNAGSAASDDPRKPRIGIRTGQVERQRHVPGPGAYLGELAVALEEYPDRDDILVHRAESCHVRQDLVVDGPHVRRPPGEGGIDRDAGYAGVRLTGAAELPVAARTRPAGHAPMVQHPRCAYGRCSHSLASRAVRRSRDRECRRSSVSAPGRTAVLPARRDGTASSTSAASSHRRRRRSDRRCGP